MQHGSINCPSHGSVVACSGAEGATVLHGVCSYGGETVSMAPQSLAGPFDRHWDLHKVNAVEPEQGVDFVIDLEQLVLDNAAAHAKIDALTARVDALHEILAASAKVSESLAKA